MTSGWTDDLSHAARLAANLDVDIRGGLDGFRHKPSFARILIAIYQYPGRVHREIGKILGISAPQLSRSITQMCDAGLVAVAEGAKDRRRREIQLTPHGAESALELLHIRKTAFQAALQAEPPLDRKAHLGPSDGD